jgi:hypothetical protein
MDRDLDLLTALLLDPFLTTNEAACEAAARRGVRPTGRVAAAGHRNNLRWVEDSPHAGCAAGEPAAPTGSRS